MPKVPQGQKRPADTVANAVWSMDDIVALIDAAEASRQFQTESYQAPPVVVPPYRPLYCGTKLAIVFGKRPRRR